MVINQRRLIKADLYHRAVIISKYFLTLSPSIIYDSDFATLHTTFSHPYLQFICPGRSFSFVSCLLIFFLTVCTIYVHAYVCVQHCLHVLMHNCRIYLAMTVAVNEHYYTFSFTFPSFDICLYFIPFQ